MRDDHEPADRRAYLMAKIDKSLRLAQAVDPITAKALRRVASEDRDELKRTYASDNKVKERG